MEFSHELMQMEEQMVGETGVDLYDSHCPAPEFGFDVLREPEPQQESFQFHEDAAGMEPSPFGTDYYNEPSYVTRGVTLPTVAGFEDPFGTPCQDMKPKVEEFGATLGGQSQRLSGDLPFGGLAATSVFLGEAQTEDVFSWLRELFTQEFLGEVLKERQQKGWVSARVYYQGGHWAAPCTIKVRLHQHCLWQCDASPAFGHQQHGLVAEFQRRGGDTLAFQAVFQRMKESLEHAAMAPCVNSLSLRMEQSEALDSTAFCSAPVFAAEEQFGTDQLLQPVLDLLQDAGRPDLQVEAVNALAVLLGTASTAVVVCHALHSVQGLLAELLSSPAFHKAPGDAQRPELLNDLVKSLQDPCCQASALL